MLTVEMGMINNTDLFLPQSEVSDTLVKLSCTLYKILQSSELLLFLETVIHYIGLLSVKWMVDTLTSIPT